MESGFPQERAENQHRSQAVQGSFQAIFRGSARRPEQPEEGVQNTGGHSRCRRNGGGFGERPQKVRAGESEERTAQHG